MMFLTGLGVGFLAGVVVTTTWMTILFFRMK